MQRGGSTTEGLANVTEKAPQVVARAKVVWQRIAQVWGRSRSNHHPGGVWEVPRGRQGGNLNERESDFYLERIKHNHVNCERGAQNGGAAYHGSG